MNKIDLNGRCAVVTGGAQGFGRAITERFVASGAKVAIWDHDAPFAEKTAREIANAVPACPISETSRPPGTPRSRHAARSETSTLKAVTALPISLAVFSANGAS